MAYTEAQLKAAAKKAAAAGDNAAAQELFNQAMKLREAPIVAPAPVVTTPPKEAQLPNDFRVGGYDPNFKPMLESTPDERLARVLKEGPPTTANMGAGEAALRGLHQGATFGFGDELSAGLVALDPNMTYDGAVSGIRADLGKARTDQPAAALAGEIGGSIIPGAGILKAGTTAATLPGRIAASTAGGALSGATYAAGSAEGGLEDRLAAAKSGALIGGGVGMAVPAVGSAIQNTISAILSKPAVKDMVRNAPSASELQALASGIFRKADDQTSLPRAALTNEFGDMQERAVRSGMDDILTPQSARAMSRIEDAATTPSPTIGFRDLDILRRQAGVAAGNMGSPVESAIGSRMVQGIDDVLEKASPETAGAVAEARAMWGKLRRSEAIDDLMSRAELHPSGFAQGVVTEMRGLLKNPKRLRGYSADEVAAMKKVVSGISPQSVLSVIGKFGPRAGQNGNVVGSAAGVTGGGIIGSLIGGPLGGMIGGVGAPAIASLAHAAGNSAARKKAEIVRALVATGGEMPKGGQVTSKAMADIVKALMLGNPGALSPTPPPQSLAR